MHTVENNSSLKMDNFQIIARDTYDTCKFSTANKFWETSNILLINPHTINRRIAVSSELLLCEIEHPEQVLNLIQNLDFLLLADQSVEGNIKKKLIDLLNVHEVRLSIQELQSNKAYLRIAKLLPRDKTKFAITFEIAIIDRPNNRLTYCHKVIEKDKRSLSTDFLWYLSWNQINSELTLHVENEVTNSKWLEEQLLKKFSKWMKIEVAGSFVSGSISLVKSEDYVEMYDHLKKKYGLEMLKIWPENTDPLKFVYEDIAIATYLLLIWKEERIISGKEKLQSFVDLGCGNGLLVHILSSEGHSGFGIDLRARKIWDLFPSSTKLEVRTIIPSSTNLFPEIDWIIGNHSDELTPWIPVIAARSSYNCRFFLLPCCAFEFDGTNYQRTNSSLSQYHEYINYVQSISEGCGFQTQVDKLRIPSTKRICLIGRNRNYLEENYSHQEDKIQKIIHKKSTGNKTELWNSNFKPREIVEKVRNCTKVDKNLIADIIKLIADKLLKNCNFVNTNNKQWNAGGTIKIKDAVNILEVDQLKHLKNECGGLQTLLKNNSHIFYTADGNVQLRNPVETVTTRSKNKRRKLQIVKKIKPCWFYENHPDGCPQLDEECNFKHERKM